MSRFVFDTNVIVSAVLFDNSVPGQAFVKFEVSADIHFGQARGPGPTMGQGGD